MPDMYTGLRPDIAELIRNSTGQRIVLDPSRLIGDVATRDSIIGAEGRNTATGLDYSKLYNADELAAINAHNYRNTPISEGDPVPDFTQDNLWKDAIFWDEVSRGIRQPPAIQNDGLIGNIMKGLVGGLALGPAAGFLGGSALGSALGTTTAVGTGLATGAGAGAGAGLMSGGTREGANLGDILLSGGRGALTGLATAGVLSAAGGASVVLENGATLTASEAISNGATAADLASLGFSTTAIAANAPALAVNELVNLGVPEVVANATNSAALNTIKQLITTGEVNPVGVMAAAANTGVNEIINDVYNSLDATASGVDSADVEQSMVDNPASYFDSTTPVDSGLMSDVSLDYTPNPAEFNLDTQGTAQTVIPQGADSLQGTGTPDPVPVDLEDQPLYLNDGLQVVGTDAVPIYNLNGDALSLVGNTTGLMVDPSMEPTFTPDYNTGIGYDAVTSTPVFDNGDYSPVPGWVLQPGTGYNILSPDNLLSTSTDATPLPITAPTDAIAPWDRPTINTFYPADMAEPPTVPTESGYTLPEVPTYTMPEPPPVLADGTTYNPDLPSGLLSDNHFTLDTTLPSDLDTAPPPIVNSSPHLPPLPVGAVVNAVLGGGTTSAGTAPTSSDTASKSLFKPEAFKMPAWDMYSYNSDYKIDAPKPVSLSLSSDDIRDRLNQAQNDWTTNWYNYS